MTSSAYRFRWIVVGGGAAGCWLARRLASRDEGSVALIEAGQAACDARSTVPAWYPLAQNSKLDWAFRTEPQLELGGRRLAWPRGKGLGGSSVINALIYMLPSQGDFQRWGRAVGGYWLDGLSEVGRDLAAATRGADSSGWAACPITAMRLEPVQETHPWCQSFLEAATAAGLCRQTPWLQSASNVCGNYWLTARHGRRQTLADPLGASALPGDPQPDAASKQPTLLTGCHAHRIVIERGRAVSVEVSQDSAERWQVFASEAIILASGAIGSPELLLRSGVGPAQDLERAGIRCLFDSPDVGGNLQDHLSMPIVFQMNSEEGLPYRFGPERRARYRISGSGPLASNIAEVGAMLGRDQLPGAATDEPAATPRVQLHVTPTHYLKYPVLPSPSDCMSIAISPLHPAARGRIRLGAAAGLSRLEIDPGYLSTAADLDDFVAAYQWTSEALAGSTLRTLIARQLIPSQSRSDAAGVARSVRALAQSIYHPVGTCRAGADAAAVVDDRFRVRGVDGLCVADASVLPDLPSGNSCAATVVMAELAARLLLEP